LGTNVNIFTGWDFVGDITPTTIFTFGWFDSGTITSGTFNNFDVYFAGWNEPDNQYGIFNSGWFDSLEMSSGSSDSFDVYFAGWNVPDNKNGIFNNGWFSSNLSQEDVSIYLEYLSFLINLGQINSFNINSFLNFINTSEVRNIVPDVNVKKNGIMYVPNRNANRNNIGLW
jgi:hypothetical protein